MRSPESGIIIDQIDGSESLNRPARVKKIKSYEEEDSETPLPSKKKKKLNHNKIPDVPIVKTKKISFFDPKITNNYDDNATQPSLVKRPRGRPPLVTNKTKVTPKPIVPTRPMPPNSIQVNLKPQLSQQNQAQPKYCAPSVPVLYPNPSPIETEVIKPVRPSITLITERVVSKLMTSDPLTASDLVARLPDAPREIVQSVLDVLHVMGVVIAVKTRETSEIPPIQISHSSSVNLYSLSGYARTQSAVKLCAVMEDTAAKVEQHSQTKTRLTALQELTMREGLTSAERTIALTSLLDRFLAEDPRLWEDPLYRVIIEHTGNIYQPPLTN